MKVLRKSKAEPFPEKLVSDPGGKAKLIKIEVIDNESDDTGQVQTVSKQTLRGDRAHSN